MDEDGPQSPSARLKRAVRRTFGFLKKDRDREQSPNLDLLSPLSNPPLAMAPRGTKGDIPAPIGSPEAERLLRDADGGHNNEDHDDLPRHSDDEFGDFERLSRTTVDTKGGATSVRSRKHSHTPQASDYDLTISRMWEFQRRSEENRRDLYERVAHDPNFPASLLPRPRTNDEAELGLLATEDMAIIVPKDIRADLEVMLKTRTPLTEIGKKLCDEYRSDPIVGSTIALMEAADEKNDAIAHAVITRLGFENVPPIASPPPPTTTTTTSSRPPWFRRGRNYAPYRAEQPKPHMSSNHHHPLPALPNAPVEEAPIVVYNNAPLVHPTPIRPGPIAARWTNEVIERTQRELREKEARLEAVEREAIDTSGRNESYARIWEWQRKQAEEAEEE